MFWSQTSYCKKGSDWLKTKVGGSSAQYSSCKVFRDWSIINTREINRTYYMGIYLLNFLKHLIAFDDIVYWCGLEKRALHFDFFTEIFLPCRVPPSGAKKW